MPTPWTPGTKNPTTWDPASEAGGPWDYDQAGISYNQTTVQYEAEKPATTWTNVAKS